MRGALRLETSPPVSCTLAGHHPERSSRCREKAELPLPPVRPFPDGAGGVDRGGGTPAGPLLERIQLLGSRRSTGSLGVGRDRRRRSRCIDFGSRPGRHRGRSASTVSWPAKASSFDGSTMPSVGGPGRSPPSVPRRRSPIRASRPRRSRPVRSTGCRTSARRAGLGARPPSFPSLRDPRPIPDPGCGDRSSSTSGPAGCTRFSPRGGPSRRASTDKTQAAGVATGGRAGPAWTPTTPGSDGRSCRPGRSRPRRPRWGERGASLEGGGWIGRCRRHLREGREAALERPLRACQPRRPARDLADRAFAAQLAGHAASSWSCGSSTLSGGALLDQLQWPNDFDTVLVPRGRWGSDPGRRLRGLREAGTSPPQAEPGRPRTSVAGWTHEKRRCPAAGGSPHLRTGRARRRALPPSSSGCLLRDCPSYPLWYERTFAGLSARVAGPARTIDLDRDTLRLGRNRPLAGSGP